MLASAYLKTLAIRNKLISKLYQLSGHTVAPTAYRISVYASPPLFTSMTPLAPPSVQHSIRVGGQPFPDRDFHPARCAKLILAR